MYKIVELFTGTGAFSLAFKHVDAQKFKVVFANDIEPTSKEVFDANNDIELTCKDLASIKPEEIPAMDILTAGFPCQPFSIAGMQNGFNDPRSNIFWKIIEILKMHQPRIAILENVKNLQAHDNGNTFRTITESLQNVGYKLKYKIVNTCKYTIIPQNRERIYIVCFREEEDFYRFQFPEESTHECVPIEMFLEEDVHSKYYYKDTSPIWERLKEGVDEDISNNAVYQYRRYYVRKNKSGVCPTLTANMGLGGHNVPIIKDSKGVRKLTPKECFGLQGFDDTYVIPNTISDAKAYKLAGNAVSVPVVELIIKQLPL